LAVSAAERRFILDNLTRLAEADIRAMWRLAEAQSDVEFAAYVIEAFPEIIGPYYELASQASATFFEEDFPAITQAPVLADSVPDEKLRKSARWALGADGDRAVSRMVGSTQRAIYDADRETTVQNAGRAGMSYVRVARPNACAFCRLLASRAANGETYSASGVIKKIDPETGKPFKDGRLTTVVFGRSRRNSKQKAGKEYHDFCHCVAQAIPRGVDPMEYLQRNEPEAAELALKWDAEYLDARGKAESEDPRAILSEWRQRPGVEDYIPKPKAAATFDRAVLDNADSVDTVGAYINGKYGIKTDGLVDSPMAKGIPIEQSLKQGRDVFSAARAAKEREMDARTAREFGQAVDDIMEKYPFLKLDAIRADYAPYGDPLTGEAYATPKLDADFKKVGAENVTISALVDEKGKEGTEWKRRQLSMLQADSRYAASSYQRPVYAVMVHEMGHVVDFNSGGNAVPAAQAAIRKYVAGLPGAPDRNTPAFEVFEKNWLKEELVSAYSFETPDGVFSRDNPVYWVEALAEAFADVEIRGEEAEVASKIIHEAMVFEARKFSTPPKSTLELLNEIKLPGVDS
jgi:hypothetical protein